MSRKGQLPPQVMYILGVIFFIWICSLIIPPIFNSISQLGKPNCPVPPACNSCCPTCPACPACEDCNPYKHNLSDCLSKLDNLTNQPNNTPICPTEYKPLTNPEVVYSYVFVSASILLVIFFSLKFHLFKIEHLRVEIRGMPEEWKKELERLQTAIGKFADSLKWAKRIVIAFTILLVIKIIILIVYG